LVLTCTEILRKRGVVGQFVEYFGDGVQTLSISDRATISNMSPEYGATMGYFPIDKQTLMYLRLTGRNADKIDTIEKYLRNQQLFVNYDEKQVTPTYSGDIITLDLSTV
jgi:aconitate hydratase